MTSSPFFQQLQRGLNGIRVENSDSKRFVPEKELRNVMSRDIVTKVVDDFTPAYHTEEVVQFILQDARKVFGVLSLISQVGYINRFIRNDQYQARCIDDLLPFTKKRLQEILNDDYVAELFYEKQWEFSVPVFSGRIIPRVLERETILPFFADNHLAGGCHGSVQKIEIHPSYRPQRFETTKIFVRKELEFDDDTYENEVRILSTLQRLKHPNILQLVGCYTYNSKHNLISPYIIGGTLREYLKREKSPNLSREDMLYSIAGLASAIWALHEFVVEDTEPTHKGAHQDLRPDNILVDGDRFILADFGLSSIKSMTEDSKTPFKGRKGYCQAPECVELERPYQENQTNRAADIFSLACIFADLLIYLIRGAVGVKDFHDAREFHIPPICYYLYHKGKSSNGAVKQWLAKAADEDGSQSTQDVVQLVNEMLEIDPSKRPKASTVTARLYISIIGAFSERILDYFARFSSSVDAYVEKARFQSWAMSQDVELYSSSSGATNTGKAFDAAIDILRSLKNALQVIDKITASLDCRSFLEVRTLNTQLLNSLSPERRSSSRSCLESILLADIRPGTSGTVCATIRSAFGDARITRMAETKHMVAKIDDATVLSATPSFPTIPGPIQYTRRLGCYKTAELHHHERKIPVVVESIRYQDRVRRQKLLPRIHALCTLLSSENLGQQLRLPPFYALYDNADAFCFDILYCFPRDRKREEDYQTSPMSLHDLLTEQDECNFPSWESRLKLGTELAESLAAFHDLEWFHKDLTSFSVLFFPTDQTTPSTRADHPYLIGFQHSRSAIDDFTEGPSQDRKHHRYHHPKYISVENHKFLRFRPRFDYYSFGILLLEIGFWATIDTIMDGYTKKDNQDFSDALINEKVPLLSFKMGEGYANIVRECLTGLDYEPRATFYESASNPSTNVLFKQNVFMQLKAFGKNFSSQGSELKRKREEEGEGRTPTFAKRML